MQNIIFFTAFACVTGSVSLRSESPEKRADVDNGNVGLTRNGCERSPRPFADCASVRAAFTHRDDVVNLETNLRTCGSEWHSAPPMRESTRLPTMRATMTAPLDRHLVAAAASIIVVTVASIP